MFLIPRALVIALLGGVSASTVGCGGALGSTRSGGDSQRWSELATPHFVVSTDLPEARARSIAQSLEEMRSALLSLAWPGAKDPRGRTEVIVFATPAEFDHYSGLNAAVAGVAVNRSGEERILSFSPGPEGDVPRVAVHELAHDLSQWFLPLQPPWLAEGLAVYLDGTKLDRSQHRAVMGAVSQPSVNWLKSTGFVMRASKLFASQAVHPTDPRESMSFYSASWFLVHYLLNQQGEGFGTFQKRLAQLVPWQSAWRQAFPELTPDALDQEILAYSHSGHFVEVEADVQPTVFEPKLRVLSPAQVCGLRASLSSSLRNSLGQTEMLEALRLDPNELNALIVRFHSIGESFTQARSEIAQRAVAAHPDKGDAWLLQAWAAPPGDQRRAALDRALALAPDHPGVALLLAEDLLQRGQPEPALEHLRLALRRSPLSPNLLALQVRALGATHRCEQAALLNASAAELFPADCSVLVPSENQRLSCAALVQRAYDAAPPLCVQARPVSTGVLLQGPVRKRNAARSGGTRTNRPVMVGESAQ